MNLISLFIYPDSDAHNILTIVDDVEISYENFISKGNKFVDFLEIADVLEKKCPALFAAYKYNESKKLENDNSEDIHSPQ